MILRKFIEKRDGYMQPNHVDADSIIDFLGTSTNKFMRVSDVIKNSNVFACVSILADDLAKLPIHTYYGDGDRTKGMKHPVAELLYTRPNHLMSAFTLKQTLQMHVGLYGNAFAFIDWGNDGFPKAIWPLEPSSTVPYLDVKTGRLTYQTQTIQGETITLQPSDVLHFKTMARDGIVGKAPWRTLVDELRGQNSTKEFISNFYKNGTLVSGVLQTDSKINQEAKDKLRKDFASRYASPDNAGKTVVLDMGLKFQTIGMQLDQAQFIETQKFGINEVAKVYRVPPHKLAQLDRATYANAEAMGLEYIKSTLLPIFMQWEQELNYKLFTKIERQQYYVKFNADAELRGDSKSRAEYYTKMIQTGVYTLNEVRAMEEQKPMNDGMGDKHFISLNYTTTDNLEKLQLAKIKAGEDLTVKGGEGNGQGTENTSDQDRNPEGGE